VKNRLSRYWIGNSFGRLFSQKSFRLKKVLNRTVILAILLFAATGQSLAHSIIDSGDVIINEIVATHSDKLIQWPDPADTSIPPKLGMGIPWYELEFDDSGWASQQFTYSTPQGPPLDPPSVSLYIRKEFTVTAGDLTSPDPLNLTMEYKGGFVAYINGREVARRNTGAEGSIVYHDQNAYNDHETGSPEIWVISNPTSILVEGQNVLAIQLVQYEGNFTDLHSIETSLDWSGNLVSTSDIWKYFVGVREPSGEYVDDDGDETDWIELYNQSGSTVNLAGWTITDDNDNEDKWSFPSINILSGEYLLIYASSKDRTTGPALHTNFNLSGNGEYLALYNDLGQKQFEVAPEYPNQSAFYSWGRVIASDYQFLGTPTPGYANDTAVTFDGTTDVPVFSHSRDYYDTPFFLTITSTTLGATIRYTTDGTEPTLTQGSTYTTAINISATTAIRARAFKTGKRPSKISTQTYFMGLNETMKSLPSMSLVTDENISLYAPYGTAAIIGGSYDEHGFWYANGPDDYNNCIMHGRAYERPVSAEYLSQTDPGFQIDCGIRVRGSGWTRPHYKPYHNNWLYDPYQKHSFQLLFRDDYGPTDLEHQIFGPLTVEQFDVIALRAGHNDFNNPYIKDELLRSLQIDMGWVTSHGTFVNMFINGEHRGFYNPVEKPNEDFFQSWYNSPNDWDVIHIGQARDGDLAKWGQLWTILNSGLDFSVYTDYQQIEEHIDVNNYIDYLLLNVYAATWDWPHNNWGAARERIPEGRFRWYIWDAEGGFGTYNINPVTFNMFTEVFTNPVNGWVRICMIYDRLKNSPDFKLFFADRIQKHFFNGGVLTDNYIEDRFNELKAIIQPMFDYLYPEETYDTSIVDSWIPNRRSHVFNHFEGQGLWPSQQAPVFNSMDATVPYGFALTMTDPNPTGTVYYTTDGSDPRVAGTSAIAPSASAYSTPLTVENTTTIKARAKDGSTWSPLTEATLTVLNIDPNDVIITEVFANADGDDENKEWFEIYNTTDSAIDLNGVVFSDNDTDSHTITGSLIILSHDYLVLGESQNTSLNGGAPVDYAYANDITLGNTSDELVISQGTTIVYSIGWGGYKSSPSTIIAVLPANEPSKGESHGMNDIYYYGPTNNSWADQVSGFGTNGDDGTPGAHNDGVFSTDTTNLLELAANWLRIDGSQFNDWCGYTDINRDGNVNLIDFAIVADYWLYPAGTIIADFTNDGIVNFKDFAKLASFWLQDEPSVDIVPIPYGDGVIDTKDLALLSQYWLETVE